MKRFSSFMIAFFPFEFLSMISALFIREEKLSIPIKAKFLEYFQKVLTNKTVSQQALKSLQYIGEEVLEQMLALDNKNKSLSLAEQNYSQKIVNLLAVVSQKKNILDSAKTIQALYPVLQTKIASPIKAQVIYLLAL
jgi:hypothetical protein